ncbi:OsmC family protein [Acidiluteibacter ferrifornacis]|mgnify:FL=1|jgi:uncharacterized OsmC-like protein|uniref:OsmC family peroxiredoxin n=1 Tax=Acidiluteibacter ferrifornacis TaxID=2692424 RepID=A0A6N9NI03_9FLAO|nr:OsmC family protein [Acidiluteibacter ferrifornacis]MBR9833034.1 OsmC family protein [bacterium]NBG66316.1 OsmC family peroxiredoxin [Acidiluteibacter ferrifornacis]
MKYTVTGTVDANHNATFSVKGNSISFGVKKGTDDLPNPVELLLGSFAACCLKNVERFSEILKYDYEGATIEIVGDRQENPTKLIGIQYVIKIKGKEINLDLLHRNIQKFGTIYNTLQEMCEISGELKMID